MRTPYASLRLVVFLGVLLGGWLLIAGSARAQSTVTNWTPASYTYTAPLAGPISLQFSQPLSAASASDSSLQVYGSLTGQRAGQWLGAGTNTLRFQPARPFLPGERVRIHVSRRARAAGGTPLSDGPTMSELTAASGRATAVFTGPTMSSTAPQTQVQGLVAADFDGDGDLDLAANAGALFTLVNAGAGALNRGETYPAMGGAAVTAADFNHDGKPDLLYYSTAGGVALRLNDGTGHFIPTSPLPDSLRLAVAYELATGDFDSDGHLDLVLTNALPGNADVRIGFGDGSGHFNRIRRVAICHDSTSVQAEVNGLTVGDFDLDGDLDLAATSMADSTVAVRFNNGVGRFSPPLFDMLAGSGVRHLTSADVDRDGDLDLIASHTANAAGHQLALFYNDGGGGFSPRVRVAFPPLPGSGQIRSLATADADGDGDPDLLVAGNAATASYVWLMRNAGVGTFSLEALPPPSGLVSQLALADFDGDRRLDVGLASSGGVAVWVNTPLTPIATLGPAPCPGTSITLDLAPNNLSSLDSVSWRFGDNSPPQSGRLVQHTYAGAGSYVATAYYWQETTLDSLSVPVTVLAGPPANLLSAADTTLCDQPGASLTLRPRSGLPAGLLIRWLNGGATGQTLRVTAPGTYILEATLGSCVGYDTVRVGRRHCATPLTISLPAPCVGAAVSLAVSATAADSVSWQFGDGSATAWGAAVSHTYVRAGTYQVSVRVRRLGSIAADKVSQRVVVYGPLPAQLIVPAPGLMSCGSKVLRARPDLPAEARLRWLGPATTSADTLPSLLITQPGRYALLVEVGQCQARDSVAVASIVSLPTALAEFTDTLFCNSGTPITLRARHDLPTGTRLRWLGPSSTPADTLPALSVRSSGTWRLQATLGSCQVQDTVTVRTGQCLPTLSTAPGNVLTPDGDGLNDAFIVAEAGRWTLAVFTRWGREVYRSSEGDYRNDWAASGLDAGTYYYYLRRSDGRLYNGWVEVIRK